MTTTSLTSTEVQHNPSQAVSILLSACLGGDDCHRCTLITNGCFRRRPVRSWFTIIQPSVEGAKKLLSSVHRDLYPFHVPCILSIWVTGGQLGRGRTSKQGPLLCTIAKD